MSDVICEKHPAIDACGCLLTNRPARRNSLSRGVIATLRDAVEFLANDKATRIIALHSEGCVFCAGDDLGEMTAHRADGAAGAAFYPVIT